MAMISQDSVLFKGTLRENLDAEGLFEDEHLMSVLEKVGLLGLIRREGLNYSVEERGRNLSGGEKQLVCIARCLLQDAPVVIMDEATSSIDPKSEEQILRASEAAFAGRTQIIIAHRLSTLLSCDRVIWLENGSIRMMGSPEAVINQITSDKSHDSLAEVLT
jgi:ABC-type multidrug transport system fused ATPase/permease subunit